MASQAVPQYHADCEQHNSYHGLHSNGTNDFCVSEMCNICSSFPKFSLLGGLMGNIACSPSDPIFYSHHAFIDWIFQEFRGHSQVRH